MTKPLKALAARTLRGTTAHRLRRLAAALVGASPTADPAVELALVQPPGNAGGWILDAICREIDRACPLSTALVRADARRLPAAEHYFFSHYQYFHHLLLRHRCVSRARSLVFYTHPTETSLPQSALVWTLNQADRIVSMCGIHAEALIRDGVDRGRVSVATIGADPVFFPPHRRSTGTVGFCTSFYARKQPDRILEIVRQMPHRQFILLGPNWHQYDRFGELLSLPNFSYQQRPYAEYPAFYSSIDVFVSAAVLEGGPVPLIEAMMSNCVPVATRTGIAPDVIVDGQNGWLCDVDAPAAQFCDRIERACRAGFDVRQSVLHLTWDRFARQIQSFCELASQPNTVPAERAECSLSKAA